MHMTTCKMTIIGVSFVLVAMLFSSVDVSSASFAQPNSGTQANTGSDDNNLNKQNYDNFQNCLDNIAGTTGFATPQQIRGCFATAYNIHDDDDDDDDDDLFED